MHMTFLTCLLAAIFNCALYAQDTQALPPLHQGFPEQLLAYGEADLTGGLGALYDFDTWESKGAVGLGYADFAALLKNIKIPLASDAIRSVVRGSRAVAGGLIDVSIEGGPTWLIVLDHAQPDSVIKGLQSIALTKMLAFSETVKTAGTQIYKLQFPTDWTDSFNPWAARRRMWVWDQTESPETYTDPISIAVWKSRYLIIGARESLVKDAIDFYTYPEDSDMTLAGLRRFRSANEMRDGSDLFIFWDLVSTIQKVDRVSDAPMGMMRRGGMGEMWRTVKEVAELDQFRSLVIAADFDEKAGTLDTKLRLDFENRPSWLEIVAFPSKPTPLTNYVPQSPGFFAAASFDTPGSALERLRTFIKNKGIAIGKPEMALAFEMMLKSSQESIGFPVVDLIEKFGGAQAYFKLVEFDDLGNRRRGSGAAVILAAKDEAEAIRFVREVLARSEDETLRKMFVHTSDRAFVECAGGKRVGYHVFNAMDSMSFSYCFLDGHVIAGNQDAVVASIRAKTSGENLSSDTRYQAFRAKLPAEALVTTYSDWGYLAHHAESILPQNAVTSSSRNPWEEDYYYQQRNNMPPDEDDIDKYPERPGVGILKTHFGGFLGGSTIAIEERAITCNFSLSGLPTADALTDIVVRSVSYENRLEARQILRHELFPAISEYLFVNGDLPATIDEFSKNSGSAILFRDPCLAGPSVEKPSLEQSFVWIGKHEGKPLLPALPLCHTRNADPDGRKLLLMSDGSVHKLLDDELKKALDAGTKGEAAPFHSSQPQTLAEVGPLLVPLCGDGNSR